MPVPRTLLLLAAALPFAALGAKKPAVEKEYVVGTPESGVVWSDVAKPGTGVNSLRIPGLAVTPKGTLVAVFDLRYNNYGDLPGRIDVAAVRSENGGKSWSAPAKAIAFDSSEPGSRGNGVGDPSMLVDRESGTVWVAALHAFGNRAWRGSGPGLEKTETGQFVLAKSDDDGRTWSEPVSITKQVKDPAWKLCFQGPGNGICTSRGALVFPAQYRAGDKAGTEHSFFIYSTDHGATWHASPPAAPGHRTTESQICERADGSLLLSMRNHTKGGKRAWAVFTPKGGDFAKGSWGPVEFQISDPVCAGGLASNPKNRSEVVFTNPAGPGRANLTAYLSTDGGKTWPHKRLIQPLNAQYSAALYLPDGAIGVIYESGKETNNPKDSIRFARITADWIKAGK